MAYPFYQNPYQYYQPAYQPQQMQAPVQPQTAFPQSAPQTSMIWVSGEREAQMYPVAPNNAVTLWSQTESVVYVKQADATGKPTLKVYDLVERGGDACMPDRKEDETGRAVNDALVSLNAKIAAITSDIEAIKGDLYGIAGKKKNVKKEAAVDDE